MFDFFVLAEKVFMFVLLMLPGYIMGKCKILGENSVSGFGEIITKVAMPCLVIVKMLETDMFSLGAVNVISCIIHVPVFIFLIYFIARLLFRNRRVEQFCSVFPNCGFLGLPLAAAMFPANPEVVVFLSIWNIFDSILVLTFGVNILSPQKQKKNAILSILRKPITIASVLGIILSYFKFGEKLPAAITYTEYFAALTTPLSMTVLGYELSKLSLRKIFLSRELYSVSIVKLFISPFVSFGLIFLANLLPWISLSPYLAAAVFIATGVATASISSALCRDSGENSSLAAIITVGTTILCVASMPIMSLVFEFFF